MPKTLYVVTVWTSFWSLEHRLPTGCFREIQLIEGSYKKAYEFNDENSAITFYNSRSPWCAILYKRSDKSYEIVKQNKEISNDKYLKELLDDSNLFLETNFDIDTATGKSIKNNFIDATTRKLKKVGINVLDGAIKVLDVVHPMPGGAHNEY